MPAARSTGQRVALPARAGTILLRAALLTVAPLLLALPCRTAAAQAPALRIGVVLPASAPAGAAEGARLGADEAQQAARLLRGDVAVLLRTVRSPEEIAATTRALVRDDGVTVLIGGYDSASFAALRGAADEHDVLFLNSGWRGDGARTDCHPLVFHVVASERMHGAARALWRSGGDSAAEVLDWHGSLGRFGAGQLNDRYRLRFGYPMNGAAWTAWMAIKIAWEGAARARSSEGASIARFLASSRGRFDGHKGIELSFRPWDHQLRQPLHLRGRGSDDTPQDVPRARPGEQPTPRELLDRLGGTTEGAACTP